MYEKIQPQAGFTLHSLNEKVVDLRDMVVGKLSSRQFVSFLYYAAEVRGAFVIGFLTKRSCISCLRRRLSSSSYFPLSAYKKLADTEIGSSVRLLKSLKMIPNEHTMYEFNRRTNLVKKHIVLPVPGCEHADEK